jgi:hypothetical protein
MGLTPIHRLLPSLPPASSDAWHVDPEDFRPQNDTGRTCVDFESREIAYSEPIDRILNASLGRRINVKPAGGLIAHVSFEEVMRPFSRAVWMLIAFRCKECIGQQVRCKCTLRSRFLDRWVCIGCVRKDHHVDESRTTADRKCQCASKDTDKRLVCTRCEGGIIGDAEDDDDTKGEQEDQGIGGDGTLDGTASQWTQVSEGCLSGGHPVSSCLCRMMAMSTRKMGKTRMTRMTRNY